MMEIVLYGAGKRGRGIFDFLKECGYGDMIYGFCDKNAESIKNVAGKKVYTLQELEKGKYIYCLTLLDKNVREQIRKDLEGETCIEVGDLPDILKLDKVKFNRDFCAYYHIQGMDDYFQEAETVTDVFWDEDSTFYKCFKQMNIQKIVEVACGRGRHIPHFMEKSEEIMLVDILQNNIDYCKNRFCDAPQVKYYKNDGYDLKELKDNYYTAVYSYDAMVHFEMWDIWSYLKEIYRVLQNGGMALIHHSNYDLDYTASFSNSPDGRSYMSKQLFAYMAYRVGFRIVSQEVINWRGIKNLDCVSLLKK